MGKNDHTSRSPAEALRWLPSLRTHELIWVLELQPTKTTSLVMASVALYWVSAARERVLLNRWGESARPGSPEQLYGAWLRAAIRAASYVEGTSEEELVRLGLWERDMGR